MNVGVIGLGAMGAYMAENFTKAGHTTHVWNRTHSKAKALAEQCVCSVAESPQALAQNCDLIVLCVSRDEDVLSMVNTIADSIAPDTIVVDTSTVSSDTAKQAAEILNTKEAHFLDCPVSGGVEGARKGTLAMMVGGDESTLDKARSTLEAIAGNIVYMGATGSGQATKAVNQIMAAGMNQAVTEALAFGQSMGLDMNKVVDVVSTGAAGNWFLQHRGKTMLAGTFDPGFKLALHHKDLSICQKMAADKNLHWASIDKTLKDYEALMEQGHGDEDISALYRLKSASLKK